MVAGLGGAASGRIYAHKLGLAGTVQIPGIMASRFRDLVASGVRDPATRLIKDAVGDEKLFLELLNAKTLDGTLPDKAIKRLNAWAVVVAAEHGGTLTPDPEPEQPIAPVVPSAEPGAELETSTESLSQVH